MGQEKKIEDLEGDCPDDLSAAKAKRRKEGECTPLRAKLETGSPRRTGENAGPVWKNQM